MSCSQLALGLSFALEMDVGQYHESDFDWMGPTSIQMLTTVGHIYNHVSVFPSGNRLQFGKKKKILTVLFILLLLIWPLRICICQAL